MAEVARKRSSAHLGQRVSLRTLARRVIRQQRQENEAKVRKEKLQKMQSIPVDALAAEFLKDDSLVDLKTRVYLVEHCLGPLVLGLEKTLKEVEKRNLVDAAEMTSVFNPVDFLASYLMRNNPRYSNFSEASPYMATMKMVETHLKDKLYTASGNQKQRIVADVQRRKSEFQHQHEQQLLQTEALLNPLWTEQPLPYTSQELTDSVAAYTTTHLTSFATSRQQLPETLTQAAAVAFLHPILTGLTGDDVAAFVAHLKRSLIESNHPEASSAYTRLSTEYPSTIAMFARF